jgi:HSP20 family protein
MRTRTYPNTMHDFAALSSAVHRNLGHFGSAYDYTSNGGSNGQTKLSLPVDIWATDEAFHIAAYLPGVDSDAVEITFSDDKLTISGAFPTDVGSETEEVSESAEESGEENVEVETNPVKFIRRELYHGNFERTLNFNVPVNADDIAATFKHGVLTLNVPKTEEILPKQIKIQVA